MAPCALHVPPYLMPPVPPGAHHHAQPSAMASAASNRETGPKWFHSRVLIQLCTELNEVLLAARLAMATTQNLALAAFLTQTQQQPPAKGSLSVFTEWWQWQQL